MSGRRNLSNAIRICLSLVRAYVWLSGDWPDADWCQPAAAEIFLPLNILGAFAWALIFTTTVTLVVR